MVRQSFNFMENEWFPSNYNSTETRIELGASQTLDGILSYPWGNSYPPSY